MCSEKFGLAYVVSKMGLLFVYDVQNLTAVYRQRISADPVFLAAANPTSGGVYVVTRRGSILQVRSSRLSSSVCHSCCIRGVFKHQLSQFQAFFCTALVAPVFLEAATMVSSLSTWSHAAAASCRCACFMPL